MPQSSKKRNGENLLLAAEIGLAVGLIFIAVIRTLAPFILSPVVVSIPMPSSSTTSTPPPVTSLTLPAAPVPAVASTPTRELATTVTTAPAPVQTPEPPANLPSATFTELFSGTGWEDAAASNAYEDYSATTISLIPEFTVHPLSTTAPTGSGANTGNLTGTVSQTGGVYTATIPAFPDLVVTSTYQGVLRFGYDPQTGNALIIYAAYTSRVFEVTAAGLIEDYSARFGPRAFGGGSNGELAVQPVIFPQDGAWWIYSGAGSTEPKLMKIQDGAVVDYTRTAFPNEGTLRAAPGPAPHEIYVTGSSASYLFSDQGFRQISTQWVSAKLNYWSGNIAAATIVRLDASTGDAASGAGTTQYFLSNDGGATWAAATPGEQVTFSSRGGDFRYKIEFSPGNDPYRTPWVDTIGLEYQIQRDNN